MARKGKSGREKTGKSRRNAGRPRHGNLDPASSRDRAGIKPRDPELLSRKEREVLKLVAGGLSNREIADVIHLAEGTVKNHVSNILTKLNCRDRTQAVLYAIHWQLI